MQNQAIRPVIYDYWDHVKALSAFLDYQRELNPQISVEMLARKSKVFKRPLLSLVLAGKRTLQEDKIAPLCKALGMNRIEDRYIRSLVRFSQCQSPDEKSSLLAEIAAQRPQTPSLEGDRKILMSRWYYLALLEFIKIAEFRNDAEWTSKRFRKKLTSEQVENALNLFLNLKLISKEEGKWLVQQEILSSTQDIPSRAIQAFHLNAFDKSKEALLELSVDEREFLGVTFPISKNEIKEIKEELRKLCRKIVMNRPRSGQCEEVASLNIQFYLLTGEEK